MASSLEQHGNTESRGNVARLVDRLSKDISLLNNSSFKPGEVHLRKAGNPGGNGAKIAVVRFSYLAQQEDELDLKEGDELEVLEDVEDGWARGQIIGMIEGAGAPNAIGKIGLFPTNFVSFASEMPVNNPSVFSTSITSSLPRVIEEKGHIENHSNGGDSTEAAKKDCVDGSHHQQQQHSATLPSTLHKSTVVAGGNRRTNPLSSTIDCAASPPTGMVNAAPPMNHPPVIPPPPSQAAIAVSRTKEMAKVIYKYEAANPDELSLPEGALITVINKKCEDDGWYEGEYNGKRGLFPENFVKLIETSASVEKASPVGSNPPPILPAKPAKPLHSTSQMPVASVRDSSVSQIDPSLSGVAGARPVQEERKSMIAGLQSKLFPTGKLPPHRPPQPLSHGNEGKEAKSASSSVEDLSKLSSLTKTRPKQANKRPPSMNFRASKQPTGANANTFDESPVLGATSFNSSISSAGSGAGRPDSFFSTSSVLGKEAAGAPSKTNAATKQPVVKQLGQSPLDPPISLVSAAPRFSTINTACSLPSPSSSSSFSSEWISRKEFEKYRTEVNRKLEEMGEKLAELSALKNK